MSVIYRSAILHDFHLPNLNPPRCHPLSLNPPRCHPLSLNPPSQPQPSQVSPSQPQPSQVSPPQPQTKPPTSQSTEPTYEAENDNLALKYKAIFWVVFGLVELLAVVRTILLFIRKYTLPLNFSSCEQVFTINSTNSSGAPERPVESGNYFRVTDLLYVTHSFLHWPEYAVLAYGLYKLLLDVSNWKKSFRNDFKEAFFKQLLGNSDRYQICQGMMTSFVILLFLTASLATPAVGIAQAYIDNELYPHCEGQASALEFHYIYQTLTIIAHIFSPAIRMAMVFFVLAVRVVWFDVAMDSNEESMDLPITNDVEASEDWKRASSKYYECNVDYIQRRDKNIPFLQAFQTWFVIQWFIYYFQALADLTRLLRPWITGQSRPALSTAYRGVYTGYNFLAFGIPHVCALKMNIYHQKYLQEKRREFINAAKSREGEKGSQLQYAVAHSLTFEKQQNGDFIPGIPGTGIKIPLDSPGYTLGILLTIFALLGSFVSFGG